MALELAILFLGTVCAASIGTLTGFGVATVLLPIASFFMDIREALLFTAVVHFASAFSRLWVFRRSLKADLVFHFAVPGIFFAMLGAFLATELPVEFLRKILALALLGYASWRIFAPHVRLPATRKILWTGGALSGLSAGLVGMGGAWRSAVFASFHLPKEAYLAVSGAIPVLLEFARAPVYLVQGVRLSPELTLAIPVLSVAAFISVRVSEKFVKHIPEKTFSTVIFVALVLAAFRFLFFA